MPKSPVQIGLTQFNIAWEQPAKNLLILEDMFSGLESNPDIIFLPEMFTTGFTMNAVAMAEDMEGTSVSWMKEMAAALQCDLAGSLIIEEDQRYYNRLVWMGPEGLRGTYDKRHLFTMAGEDRVYTGGKDRTMIQKSGWNFYPFICYDVRFPVWTRVDASADVLVFVANFPEKRIDAWSQLLIARAIENQCYVVGLNRVGWDGEQHYYNGASVVVDPMGKIILALEEREEIGIATLDGVELQLIRQDLPFLNDADEFKISL
ncbi:MAG: nitrilase family protein [Saprospiraceae bacterium]|nr:nitrilase family protein [Saprospiraceae bacterium]